MEKGLKVSIIIPIYNVAKYIERCLTSVINQNYQNIEAILVDDCGTDNSMEIVEHFIQSYKNNGGTILFKIITHNKNRGLSAARNSGIAAAEGDYIYALDSDDEITSGCIEELVRLAIKYIGVDIVQGNMQYVVPFVDNSFLDWRDIAHKNLPEFINNKSTLLDHLYNYTDNNFIPINFAGKFIRKEFIVSNSLDQFEGIIHEDEHWMFKMSECISSIAFSKDFTYIHYANEGSIMLSGSNYKSINSWAIILDDVYFSLQNPCLKLKRSYCIFIVKDQYFRINMDTEEKNLVAKYKCLIHKMQMFSFKKCDFVSGLLLTMLYCLPFFLRKNRVITKIYRKVFKQKTILSLMHYKTKK